MKVAPDLAEADKADVAAVALKLGVDGLVVSNTTITRPPEVAAHRHGGEVCLLRVLLGFSGFRGIKRAASPSPEVHIVVMRGRPTCLA